MKYALTINPDFGNWDEVKTYIIEARSVYNIRLNLRIILMQLLGDENKVDNVISADGGYIIRNCDNVDYTIGHKGK